MFVLFLFLVRKKKTIRHGMYDKNSNQLMPNPQHRSLFCRKEIFQESSAHKQQHNLYKYILLFINKYWVVSLFLSFHCSSQGNANDNQLFSTESKCGRSSNVVIELHIQFYLHVKFGLAIWQYLLYCEQFRR